MSDFCILRAEKIKTRDALVGRHAHNTRTLNTVNADRHIVNIDLLPTASAQTILEKWDNAHAQNGSPKFRKDAVIALELLMTFSPDKTGVISPEKWGAECLRFAKSTFGGENILSALLHLDEKTPHVHVILAPFHERKLRAAHWIDGPQKCRALQDTFHAQVGAQFGLVRGVIGSDRKHIPQKQLYKTSNDLQHAADSAIKKLSEDTPERFKITMPDFSLKLLTGSGRADYVREMQRQVSRHWQSALRREQERFRTQLRPLVEIAKQHQLLTATHAATQKQLESVMTQNVKISNQFKNLSDQYRDLPLLPIAERILGISGRREGTSFVLETDEHKIVITGEKFKDFKRHQHGLGGGAIDLVMHLLNFDFHKAIRYLAADFGDTTRGAINSYVLRVAQDNTREAISHPLRFGFSEQLARYGARDDQQLEKVRSYLIQERFIPAPVVDEVIAKGDLWANRWASCVFAHRSPTGELSGCSIRGTSCDFKQTLGNKASAWFSIGDAFDTHGELVAVESPIDALSFAAFEGTKDRTIISTAGASDPTAIINLNRAIMLAQDNDEAGNRQAETFITFLESSTTPSYRRMVPPAPHKDWNDALSFFSTHELNRNHRLANGEKQTTGSQTRAHSAGIHTHADALHPQRCHKSHRMG